MKIELIKVLRGLSFKEAFECALEITKQEAENTKVFIKRGSWSAFYFWEMRDFSHKAEDVQFKAVTIDFTSGTPTVAYLPLSVTNMVLVTDAVETDWELFIAIEKN